MSEGSSSSAQGPILKSLKYLIIGSVIVYALQLSINPIERRPYIACWLPYLGDRFVSVTIRRIFTPTDHISIIENATRSAEWNKQCINKVGSLPFINTPLPWQNHNALVSISETHTRRKLTEDEIILKPQLDFSDMDSMFPINPVDKK